MIPPEYRNQKSLGDIANVILQGVNNTKDDNVYKIGMSIFNEISSKRLPDVQSIRSDLDNIPNKPIVIKKL